MFLFPRSVAWIALLYRSCYIFIFFFFFLLETPWSLYYMIVRCLQERWLVSLAWKEMEVFDDNIDLFIGNFGLIWSKYEINYYFFWWYINYFHKINLQLSVFEILLDKKWPSQVIICTIRNVRDFHRNWMLYIRELIDIQIRKFGESSQTGREIIFYNRSRTPNAFKCAISPGSDRRSQNSSFEI